MRANVCIRVETALPAGRADGNVLVCAALGCWKWVDTHHDTTYCHSALSAVKDIPMSFLAKILSAMTPPPSVPKETDVEKRRSDKRVVGLHSNGNIRLQNGQYVTSSDLTKQYERVKSRPIR